MGRRISIASISSMATVVAALSACASAPATTASSSAATHPSHAASQPRVPGEYLVTLAAGEDESVISERYRRFGIKQVSALGDETFLLILSNDPGPQQMEALIQDDARIEAIQPNLIYWANRSGDKTK